MLKISNRCSIVNCGKEFKLKTHLARHYAQAHGIAISSSSPRPIMKTRTAFYLHTNPMTRLARIVCRNLIRPKKAARQTSYAINTQLVKQECKCIRFLIIEFLYYILFFLILFSFKPHVYEICCGYKENFIAEKERTGQCN